MQEKHETWCMSNKPYEGACDCREIHPSARIPKEPSAADILSERYPPGRTRPRLVQKYLKEHQK